MNNEEEMQKVKYNIYKKRMLANFLGIAFIIPMLFFAAALVVLGFSAGFSAIAQVITMAVWIVLSAVVAIFFTKEE